jgi:hypothetical protein
MKSPIFPKVLIGIYCVLFLLFVYHFAVNFPYQDDVNLLQTTLFENDFIGLFRNLFSADSDHIQVFPKLSSLLQYKIFGLVNFKWLSVWMNLLVIIALFFLIKIPKNIKNYLFFLPIFLFILQPQLYEISFWVLPGLQHSYALLFVILAVYCLDISKKYNFLALFFAACATFCTGNGLLAFVVIGYILLLYRKPLWSVIGGFVFSLSVYFYNYKPSPAVTDTVNLASIIKFNSLFWASPFEVFNRMSLHKIGGILIIVALVLVVLYFSVTIFRTKSIASLPIGKLIAILFFCAGTSLLISLSREYDVIFNRFQFYAFAGLAVFYLLLLEYFGKTKQQYVFFSLGSLMVVISIFSFFANFVKIENNQNKYLADTFNWNQNKMMMMVDGPFLNLANETYDKVDNVKIKIEDDLISENDLNNLIVKRLEKSIIQITLDMERDKYARRYFANDHYLLSSPDFNLKNSISEKWFLVFSSSEKKYILATQYYANFKSAYLKSGNYYQKGFLTDVPALNFVDGNYNIYLLKSVNKEFELFDSQYNTKFVKGSAPMLYK